MIDPRRYQPPLPSILGLRDPGAVLDSLRSISIDGSATQELAGYATEDCERFIRTVDLIPKSCGAVLEIGANPYFTTLLAKWCRQDLTLTLTNYFGGDTSERTQTIDILHPSGRQERHEFSYLNINTELNPLPYPDGAFDCVLFCEVLEHLTVDPLFALLELHRVLKQDGALVLTTPNVARLENVARLVAGANLYDPYSGYGPYGRHNREYTRHELWHLLRHCGFEPEIMFTADVTENRAGNYSSLRGCEALLSNRLADLGQYHFTRSRRVGSANALRPAWLYRSLPAEQMDPVQI